MSGIRRLLRAVTQARSWQAAALLTVALTASAQGQSLTGPAPELATFEKATQDYARMHRRLESQIGTIEFGTPVAEINRRINELAAAIRGERHDAAPGDLFTLPVAAVLRARIHGALVAHGYSADDVRAAGRVGGWTTDAFTLVSTTPSPGCSQPRCSRA